MQAVKNILRTLIEVIDEEYISTLRDMHTDMVHQSIPDIFHYLMTTCGQLSLQQIKDRENEIDNLTYDPATNVNTIFNRI